MRISVRDMHGLTLTESFPAEYDANSRTGQVYKLYGEPPFVVESEY